MDSTHSFLQSRVLGSSSPFVLPDSEEKVGSKEDRGPGHESPNSCPGALFFTKPPLHIGLGTPAKQEGVSDKESTS